MNLRVRRIDKDERNHYLYLPSYNTMIKAHNKDNLKQMIYEEDVIAHYQLKLKKPVSKRVSKSVPKRLGGLIFNLTEICNLACTYCMVSGGTYDSASEKKYMQTEDCIGAFMDVLKNYEEGVSLICFFGGEPMLNFEVIESSVNEINALCQAKGIKKPDYSIITNGTIMNEKIIRFLDTNNISISISIDGLKEFHDSARVYHNGKGSFDTIRENLQLIKQKRKQFPLYAECTIHAQHFVGQTSLRDFGYDYVKAIYELGFDCVYIFPVDSDDDEISLDGPENYERLADFYSGIYDFYMEILLNNELNKLPPAHFIGVFGNIVTKRINKACRAGIGTLFMNPNGDYYPCHLFYQTRHLPLGNKSKGLKITEDHRQYLRNNNQRLTIDKCEKCRDKNLCFLWCAGSSLISNGSIRTTIDVRCSIVDMTVDYVLKALAEIKEDNNKMKQFSENLKRCSTYFKRGD